MEDGACNAWLMNWSPSKWCFLQHAEVLTLTGRSDRLKNPLSGLKPAKALIGSEAEK